MMALVNGTSLLTLFLCVLTIYSVESGRRSTPTIINARVREEVTLKCPLEQATTFTRWYKNSFSITESSAIRLRNQELRIKNVQHEDQGTYSCEGVGGFGTQPGANFTLLVYDADVEEFPENPVLERVTEREPVAPRFMENPPGAREQEFSAGSNARLKCRVEAYPQASIEWNKNDRRVDPLREDISKEGYVLKFTNIQPSDEGRYTCQVYNGYGAINYTYIVTVTDPNLPLAKVIPPYPLNTSVTFGSTASLQCRVRSNSRPTIMWLKQTNRKEDSTYTIHNKTYRLIKQELLEESDQGAYLDQLIIENVQMDDAGVYVCLGLNQGGGSDIRKAHLTVIQPPVMATTTALADFNNSSWEYILGSRSATFAVIIAVPVVITLIVIIVIIYGVNKRKKSKRGHRRPPNSMLSDHEVNMPLNMNANNGCYAGQYANGSQGSYNKAPPSSSEPRYTDKLYKSQPYRAGTPQQYSQYYPSDGSYRSSLNYPGVHPHQQTYLQDIPDSDSHFSSVSHTRPQYMSNGRNPYDDRDIHSDPAASRAGGHHCPPPPPGSYYSEQW